MKIDFSELNSEQEEAVKCTKGPSLIIAGAGSGKTRVLTYRIAHLLENGADPASILALTFTNKAAKEMKERICAMVGRERSIRLWAGTFHSIFSRFLRENAELIGFPSSFTIYDSSDSKSAIKKCIKELQLDENIYKPQDVLSRISFAKNNLITSKGYLSNATAIANDTASRKGRICDIYAKYAEKCLAAGVMDFDDLLLYMNILLRDHPQVCDSLSQRFRYILVDEYQDTNYAQYLIVKKLSTYHKNITVVGDDSQSIYGFRGARIQNILNFKKDYPETKEFRLEQNYRSTQTIVNAANSLISKNSNRLKKECFSKGEIGEKIKVIKAFTEQDEGGLIASSIVDRIYKDKASYDQFAILYRTNAQSRIIEESLRKRNLPYKIYSGHSFYERAEVKDTLAYLRIILNPSDDEAFKRITKFPVKGIGETSMGYLAAAANANNLSLWNALTLSNLEEYGLRSGAIAKFRELSNMIRYFQSKVDTEDAYAIAIEIANASGVLSTLKNDPSIEAQARLENVEELLNSVNEFVENAKEEMKENGEEEPVVTLQSYMENVALLSDADSKEEEEDRNSIKLMTIHTSKGLEFPYIYIIGVEENLFPSLIRSSSIDDIEEERRLFYVALTRGGKAVAVSFSKSRFKYGEHVSNPPSRFLREIAPEYLSEPISTEENCSDPFSQSNESSFGGRRSFGDKTSFSGRTSIIKGQPSPAVQEIDPNFVPSPSSELRGGQIVEHNRFGRGKIISIEDLQNGGKAVIEFEIGGKKTLLLKYAKIRIIS